MVSELSYKNRIAKFKIGEKLFMLSYPHARGYLEVCPDVVILLV